MKTQKTILEQVLQKVTELEAQLTAHEAPDKKEITESGFLKFTEKEISKMPTKFRKTFRINGCTAHVRKRCDGRYNCSYEIRYARDGYNISASGTTLELAKQRFIEKLIAADNLQKSAYNVPRNFNGFAMYWFENFHVRKVGERTYNHDVKLYKRHIADSFGKYAISAITPYQLQTFLDVFDDRPKTKNDIRSLFNQIFENAIKHGLIKLNPLGIVLRTSYEKQHGKALSKAEEQLLLQNVKKCYRSCFAIALYTGLRPNEYKTAVIDGKFIKAVNSKRHNNGKVVYKRIPISPMLRPHLDGAEKIVFPSNNTMTEAFKKILPTHKLYDLRTTFQTRCSECGVPDNVIGIFMGNSIGKLKEAYTDFSDEYLLSEAEKLVY